MKPEFYHESVLLLESVGALVGDQSSGVYVDATFGGGGHSVQILKSTSDEASLLAFDQDEDALKNSLNDKRLTLVQSNFKYVSNYLDYFGLDGVDGVLADLGVSSFQFDKEERGFSIRGDADLDMRMNKSSTRLKASEILQQYSQVQLQELFSKYGEVKFAKSLSQQIVQQRSRRSMLRTGDLISCVMDSTNHRAKVKELAQVFQALRIEVNDEMGVLEEFLSSMSRVVRKGGRLVVISYHSLEDRLVKRFLQNGNFSNVPDKDDFGNVLRPFDPLVKKPITPSEEEIHRNPRSRSAKMRVGIRR